jgi:hypothetical protein
MTDKQLLGVLVRIAGLLSVLDGAKQLWLSVTIAVHPMDERPLPPI